MLRSIPLKNAPASILEMNIRLCIHYTSVKEKCLCLKLHPLTSSGEEPPNRLGPPSQLLMQGPLLHRYLHFCVSQSHGPTAFAILESFHQFVSLYSWLSSLPLHSSKCIALMWLKFKKLQWLLLTPGGSPDSWAGSSKPIANWPWFTLGAGGCLSLWVSFLLQLSGQTSLRVLFTWHSPLLGLPVETCSSLKTL